MRASERRPDAAAPPADGRCSGRDDLLRIDAGRFEISVARHAGYCYGVERALRIAEEAARESAHPVATLGPIIHNPSVVARLAEQGVGVVEDVADAAAGTLIVRTHGVAPDIAARARAGGLRVVDATCPFVAKAQRKAEALQKAGYVVVILGERDHPEVAGLEGFAGRGALVAEEAAGLSLAELRGRRVGVVVQTTQTRANLQGLVATLAPVARELLVYNTICDATEKRQSAACRLAAVVDVVVVVGGRNSANTARLAQLCRAIEERTHHIESATELRAEWVEGARRVGVTGGASTPDQAIAATIDALRVLGGA